MPWLTKAKDDHKRHGMRRFPIEQDVYYRCLKGDTVIGHGVGKTVEMSSREVRITTEGTLQLKQRLEVTVNWPAMIGSACFMKLVISGHIVSSGENTAAVRIDRHEFRTRGSKPPSSSRVTDNSLI